MTHMMRFGALLFALAQNPNHSLAPAPEECGVNSLSPAASTSVPWFGNNEFLDAYREEKLTEDKAEKEKVQRLKEEYGAAGLGDDFSTASLCTPTRYLVPVRVVVYRDNNGNGGITPNQVNQLLADANSRYRAAGASMQFFLVRDPVYKNNTYYQSGLQSDSAAVEMFLAETNPNHITIHVIEATTGGYDHLGMGILPQAPVIGGLRSLWVKTGSPPNLNAANVGATLSHELGHVLGLYHTHEPGRAMWVSDNASSSGCYQESVSRVKRNYWYHGCTSTDNQLKCSENGDYLCDTEADPNMNFMNVDQGSCTAAVRTEQESKYQRDDWGETWRPSVRNIMGYNNRGCRNLLSQGQRTIAWYYAERYRPMMPVLSGSAGPLCGGSEYTYGIPAIHGATYQWSVNGNLTITSGQGTPTARVSPSVTTAAYGEAAVTVRTPYTEFCLAKSMPVGPPPVANIQGPQVAYPNSSADFYVSSPSTGAFYDWQVSHGLSYYPYGSGVSVSTRDTSFTVSVTPSNTCGSSSTSSKNVYLEQCPGQCPEPW